MEKENINERKKQQKLNVFTTSAITQPLFIIAVGLVGWDPKSGRFSNAQLSMDFPLADETDERCLCSKHLQPVCGKHRGQSYVYRNLCTLACNQKHLDGWSLLYSYDGFCCQERPCAANALPVCDLRGQKANVCPCSKPCPYYEQPVCDSYGKTHKNRCLFKREQCYLKLAYGIEVTFKQDGPCCVTRCHGRSSQQQDITICDSKGRTHRNLCDFDKMWCQERRLGISTARIMHKGSCRNVTSAKEIRTPFIAPFPDAFWPALSADSSFWSKLINHQQLYPYW
ncbi:hypothetical protein T08_5783 [Trichinella sp. T8]|nr:hypothetical protein T08_5783 [Trichinella sp. T8]